MKNIKDEFKEDFFILGQLVTNLRYSNPKSINNYRFKNNKEELSEEEYKKYEKEYKELNNKYANHLNYMEEKYGNIDEAVEKYNI